MYVYMCVWIYVLVFCVIDCVITYVSFNSLLFQFSIIFNKNLIVYNLWSWNYTYECLALNLLWWISTADWHKFCWKEFEHTNPVHDGNAVLLTCRTSKAVLILPFVVTGCVACPTFYKQISANPVHNRQSYYYMPAAWKKQLFLNAVPFAANLSFITPN